MKSYNEDNKKPPQSEVNHNSKPATKVRNRTTAAILTTPMF